MLIRSLRIRNFRSCEDVEVAVDRLTAIVGANGCGKSAALRALELFYAPTPKFGLDDFFAHDTTRDIEIEVTFDALTDEEKERFRPYLEGDQLTVARVMSWVEGKPVHRLHGSRMSFGPFAAVRSAGKAVPMKAAYQQLRSGEIQDLPAWSSQAEALAALDAWESANPTRCTRMRDAGAFFGFKEVGQGYLGRSTKLLFIPAVRDAANDAQDGKGSVIAELMDLVVRRTLSEHPDFKKLVEDTRAKYREVFDPSKFEQLEALSGNLTTALQTYVPSAAVDIQWETSEIELPLPRANVRVAEDGFHTQIAACGHGLQRAFILTLLQRLAATQPGVVEETGDEGAGGGSENTEPIPDLVLVIEEPELFQHPSRQRHFAQVLRKISSEMIPGVARRAQVLYCTHSPLFVGVDRFDQVRLFRKVSHETAELPKVTEVQRATLHDIAIRLAAARDEDPSGADGEALRARLTSVITPGTSEGFFADVAVLVEGEGDRAVVLAVAESLNLPLESAGIAVIPCTGKSNVLNLAAVFTAFGIATYCLWDGDAGKGETQGDCGECRRPRDKKPDPKENERLLRLHAASVAGFPPLKVEEKFACFETDLESTLQEEIGKVLFGELLDDAKELFGMSSRSQAKKNPRVLAEVLKRARERGMRSASLEDIVQRIVALRNSSGVISLGAAPLAGASDAGFKKSQRSASG